MTISQTETWAGSTEGLLFGNRSLNPAFLRNLARCFFLITRTGEVPQARTSNSQLIQTACVSSKPAIRKTTTYNPFAFLTSRCVALWEANGQFVSTVNFSFFPQNGLTWWFHFKPSQQASWFMSILLCNECTTVK